jgi:hypothetical protein
MKRPSSMRLLVTAMAATVILGALVGVAIASDSTSEPKAATAPTVVSPADNAISSVASGEALVDGPSSVRATEVMTKEEIAAQSRQVDGHYPKNAQGLTYGSQLYATLERGEPDLILATATNGKDGYVLRTDLEGPMPGSPQEALSQQAAQAGKDRVIPVYQSDGTTQIGVFVIQAGSSTVITQDGGVSPASSE